jgi:pimeloyl-ACP methyl ester carboxylesterase
MIEVIARHPKTAVSNTPLLCVHGILHGAWCYDEFWLSQFADAGYHAYAMSLRGHGSSPAQGTFALTSIQDYVQDVAEVAQTLEKEYGKPPIIIGHSMGGLITQRYLEKHPASGAVLLASVPIGGALRPLLETFLHYPLDMTIGFLTLDLQSAFKKNHKIARWGFFSEAISDATLDTYSARLSNESVRAIMGLALLELPNVNKVQRVPMLVIHAEKDRLFNTSEQERMANIYSAKFVILPNTAHDVMLEPTQTLGAQEIIKWLKEKQL